MEYLVKEIDDETGHMMLRHTCEGENGEQEAVEWANFYGPNTVIIQRDDNFEENIIWVHGDYCENYYC